MMIETNLAQEEIRLDAISLLGGMQPRSDIDMAVVDEYAAAMEAGAEFPPATVFFDGKKYWLADGFHRWYAARKAKLDKFIGREITILCDVRKGTLEEARWFSYSVNATHGLRRTNDDKRKAVESALRHPNGAKMSDNQIAKHVGVSHPFVGRVRQDMESAGSLETVTSRAGADGRTINTSNIGSQPEADETPGDDSEIVEVYEDEEPPEGYEYEEVDDEEAQANRKEPKPEMMDLSPKLKDEDLPALDDPWTGDILFESVALHRSIKKLVKRWPLKHSHDLADLLREMANSLEKEN